MQVNDWRVTPAYRRHDNIPYSDRSGLHRSDFGRYGAFGSSETARTVAVHRHATSGDVCHLLADDGVLGYVMNLLSFTNSDRFALLRSTEGSLLAFVVVVRTQAHAGTRAVTRTRTWTQSRASACIDGIHDFCSCSL